MNLNHRAYGVAMSDITSQAIDTTTQTRNPGFYPLAIGYWLLTESKFTTEAQR